MSEPHTPERHAEAIVVLALMTPREKRLMGLMGEQMKRIAKQRNDLLSISADLSAALDNEGNPPPYSALNDRLRDVIEQVNGNPAVLPLKF